MKNLKEEQIYRLGSLTVITVVMLLLNILCVMLVKNSGLSTEGIGGLSLDGADFNFLMRFFGTMVDGVIQGLIAMVCTVAIILLSAATYIPWRFIAIKKDSTIGKIEVDYASLILLVFIFEAFITDFILLGKKSLFMIVIWTLVPALLHFLLGIISLKIQKKKSDVENVPFS